MPRELQTKKGDTLYIVERHELEGAPGWAYTHGGAKGRGACIMHGGDNRTAMEADFKTGWISCHTRGCVGRLADHPDTLAGNAHGRIVQRPPHAHPAAHRMPMPPPPPDPEKLAGLHAALAAARERLPGSAGERYLLERGFTLEQAQAWGLGFELSIGKKMRSRLIFPLMAPDGTVISATGRDTTGQAGERYWTLPAEDFTKGWMHGVAVTIARDEGLPLYCCEGPFDALALLVGGIRTAVGMLGTAADHVDWLAGVRRVIVCFDEDDAGKKAAPKLAFAAGAVGAEVELLPATILGAGNDLGGYWQAHRALPPALVEHWEEAQANATPRGSKVVDIGELLQQDIEDMIAKMHSFSDDELRALRLEYQAAPDTDPVTQEEWAALFAVERMRGWRD